MSVIICVYNSLAGVKSSIESAIAQNYRPLEVIPVDDSTDRTLLADIQEIIFQCSNIDEQVPILFLRNKKNLGTVRSLNRAILKSSQDFIFPLFPKDHFVDENQIDRVAALLATGTSVVFAKRRVRRSGNKCDNIPNEWPKCRGQSLLRKVLANGNVFSGASTYYRKDFFVKYGLFDTNYRLLEDYPNILRLVDSGISYQTVDFTSIEYDTSGISSNLDANNKIAKDLLLDLIALYKFYLKRETCITWKRRIKLVLLEYQSAIRYKRLSRMYKVIFYIDVLVYRFVSSRTIRL